MAIGKDGAVLRQLGTLFNLGTVRDLTDGQLLEQFATDRGEVAEQAFAILVERHGPMVQRVCRGVLANPHDSHDAFQATFLILVKKARALWVRDSLGPWLHQVAYRTASCARLATARRRRHERRAAKSEEDGRGLSPPPSRSYCSTKRSIGSRNGTGLRSSSATWKDAPTSRPRGIWAGRSERSRVGCREAGSSSAAGC